MCLKPITIRNPTFSRISYATEFGRGVEIPRHLTPSAEYISVPCCKCAECRQTYYNSILQRALVEARTSYMYFVTLTYDNAHIPIITLPTGEDIYYTEYSDVQNLFKRFRNHKHFDRDFRYLVVNEYGDQYARPHVHALIFVARKEDDNTNTPYDIEKVLFDNLRTYWSRNIGTRKNPIYEPLFTYKIRYTSNGPISNYFVKYISPKDSHDYNAHDIDTLYTKTIRYLISYVNKGNNFDTTLEHIISNYDDPYLVKKLRSLLSSKVRYSKGFGCGFMYGQKHYMPIISQRCSGTRLYFSDYWYNLPYTFAEYIEVYDNLDDLNRFLFTSQFHNYTDLPSYLRSIDAETFKLFAIICKYFPNYVDIIYKRYFSKPLTPTICYFFNILHPTPYKSFYLRSHNIELSPTFEYLRTNVEKALKQSIPYLAYFNETDGTYTALCPYYRQRITTIEDFEQMLINSNLYTYDNWKAHFTDYKNLQKVARNIGNITKHAESTEIILPIQKKYLDLHQSIKDEDFYIRLFSKN